MKRIFTRLLIAITLLFSALSATAENINADDWLLWYETETQMPFRSSLAIYPPVTLQVIQRKLVGSIATPYSLNGDKNRKIAEFLIIVIDGAGRSHFLQPTLDSVGFVGEQGLAMSSLTSDSFTNGVATVRLYKTNSEINRNALRKRQKNEIARNAGIAKALSELNISEPQVGQRWTINATSLDGRKFKNVVAKSKWTIVQLYSSGCGFCRQAIPFMNELANSRDISVVGVAGPKNADAFQHHLTDNNVHYPFVSFEGNYTESALLQALGQLGFPTYFVLDSEQKVHAIYVGTQKLEKWLTTIEDKRNEV